MYFFVIADITPEELFNMFFGGFGGISGGKKKKCFFNQVNWEELHVFPFEREPLNALTPR